MKPFNSLRARMTVAVTCAFAIWMIIVSVGLSLFIQQRARHLAEHALRATASAFSHDILDDVGNDPAKINYLSDATLGELIVEHRLDLLTNNLALLVVDAHGQVILRSQLLAPRWPRDDKDSWIVQTMPAGQGRLLVLGFYWDRVEDRIHELVLQLLFVSLCVIFAAALSSWALVGRTLSPISRLSHQARNASTESLYLHLYSPSHDVELVELVGTLNDLLSRLRETAEAKGRFYAAASHELRTPLQALSGHLEVALSRPRSAEDYHETLEESYNQTRRLILLTRDLLLLNQLETATKPPECELISISDICERELLHLQPLIELRSLRLATDIQVEGEIFAPPMHTMMLIRNILENAVKYATSAGEVRLCIQEKTGNVRVDVFNSYPPCPEWNSELLYEPFYRPDVSRNAKTGGNGLGLAICKAIALANGWTLTLEHTGDGVQATLLLSVRVCK